MDFRLVDSRMPDQKAEHQKGPISRETRNMLVAQAQKLWGGKEVTEQKGTLSSTITKAFEYAPSSYDIGNEVGRRMAVVHGPLACNRAIEFVVRNCFKEVVKNPTLWERITGTAQKPLTEVAKLAITPKMMEHLPNVAAIGGGLGAVLLAQGIASAYNRAMGVEDKNLVGMSLEKLVQVDKDGYLTDFEGNRLTIDEFKEIQILLAKHILLMELTAKGLVKAEAEKILRGYLITREDGEIIYLNGNIVPEEELEAIEAGVNRVAVYSIIANQKQAKEEVRRLVELLASNLPMPDLQAKPAFWRDYLIKCGDGNYCVINEELAKKSLSHFDGNLKVGALLRQEELDQAWEKEKDQMSKDFDEIVPEMGEGKSLDAWQVEGAYVRLTRSVTNFLNYYRPQAKE